MTIKSESYYLLDICAFAEREKALHPSLPNAQTFADLKYREQYKQSRYAQLDNMVVNFHQEGKCIFKSNLNKDHRHTKGG